MPDSEIPPVRCQMHETRINTLEGKIDDVLTGVRTLKERLLGNGQIGVIEEQARRIQAIENNERVQERVQQQITAIESSQTAQSKMDFLGTPLYAWVLLLLLLGPKGVEVLVGMFKALHSLWS